MSYTINLIVIFLNTLLLLCSGESFYQWQFEEVFNRPEIDIQLTRKEMTDLIPRMIQGLDHVRHIDINGFTHKGNIHKLGGKINIIMMTFNNLIIINNF